MVTPCCWPCASVQPFAQLNPFVSWHPAVDREKPVILAPSCSWCNTMFLQGQLAVVVKPCYCDTHYCCWDTLLLLRQPAVVVTLSYLQRHPAVDPEQPVILATSCSCCDTMFLQWQPTGVVTPCYYDTHYCCWDTLLLLRQTAVVETPCYLQWHPAVVETACCC